MNRRLEPLLYAGALLLAGAGYAADRAALLDNAFPRSGSLIVALGVALAGRGLYAAERALSREESRFDKLEATTLDAAADGATRDPEAFARIAASLAEYRSARVADMGRLVQAEIAIVSAGTFIWGFGDLVV